MTRAVAVLRKALKPLQDCGPCAPQPGEPYTPYTCYTHGQLMRIVHAWNLRNPHRPVPLPPGADKRQVWEALRGMMSTVCGSEACWAPASGAYHRHSPAHKVAVSFTDGITDDRLLMGMKYFMSVHQAAAAKYMFLGVYARDFTGYTAGGQCVGGPICTLTVKDVLARGKQGFCMILNTDTHTQSGEHWVAFFCCLDHHSPNFGAYYYDSNRVRSYRLDVPSRVRTYVKRISMQAASLGRPGLKLRVRSRTHQDEDGPCGLFAMAFCIVCLLDLPVQEYMSSKHVNDDLMMEVMMSIFMGKPPIHLLERLHSKV